MPKSKRDKKVSLTKTKRKGLEQKQKLIEEISECLRNYKYIFTFSVNNMRNVQLKEVRQEWAHSRFFFGKNKIMARALAAEGAEDMSDALQGQMGLLFTNKKKKAVLSYFDNFRHLDYARAGNKATQTVVLDAGPIPEFSHAIEPQLRQLGLPTSLRRGIVTLDQEHTVCKEGEVLSVSQTRILKQFGHKMAEFHIQIKSMRGKNLKWEHLEERPSPVVARKAIVKANAAKKEESSMVVDDISEQEADSEENSEFDEG